MLALLVRLVGPRAWRWFMLACLAAVVVTVVVFAGAPR